MKVAVTGGTGFLGRYIVRRLVEDGHQVRGWHRASSDRSGFEDIAAGRLEWVEGSLREPESIAPLIAGCDAVVHAGLDLPGSTFQVGSEDVVDFAEQNIVGTLRLIEAARVGSVERFVYISSCAVHDVILPDRPLNEQHPTWAKSHYGTHKAAVEQFVYSYGLGEGYAICSLRPCGIYGVAHPPEESPWFDLIQQVVRGETVRAERGGKEVHAGDVARGAALLLAAPAEAIAGQAFNCCDRYVSEWDIAHLAKELSGSSSTIKGQRTSPKNSIDTTKIQELGLRFGGEELLRRTIGELVAVARG